MRFYLLPFFVFFCFVGCGSGATESESDAVDLDALSNRLDGTDLQFNTNGNLLFMKFSETEFERWNQGNAYEDLTEKTQIIYESFQDAFDFIVFISANQETPRNLYSGRLFRAQNQVRGLGLSTYSHASEYGSSNEKLKAVIHLANLYSIVYGPLLHEIAHLWGNFLFSAKAIGPSGQVGVPSHWGYSNVGGQLGGFDAFQELGGDLYEGSLNSVRGDFGPIANGGNSLPYAPIELYLMGLLDAQQVPTLHYFEGLQASSSEVRQGRFHANRKVSLSIEQIQQQHGVREPNVDNAQKSFIILFVLVSATDVTEEQWEILQGQADSFTLAGDDERANNYNFWEATQGRGTLHLPKLWKVLQ